MKSHLDHMPPLERGDAPWTDAEMRVREAMMSVEVEVPAELESSVMKALDAPASGGGSSRAWVWGAAILLGGVLVWANWSSPQPQSEETELAVPKVEAETAPADETVEPALEQVQATPASAIDDASKLGNAEVAEVQTTDKQEVPDSGRMAPLESMDGRAATQLETEARTSPDLRQQETSPRLERRPATLEVKQ